MIPMWKLAREIDRLKIQARAIPLAVIEPFVQRRYDARRQQDLKITNGAQSSGKALAVFLVFQPKGVAPSVFKTCQHLIDNGYAPLVISNTPLSDEDRNTFARLSHVVVERSNFGYDFGGYRDGVWLVGQLGLNPARVLFLNDSVWFPITTHSNLLSRMTDAPGDYIGTQVFGDTTASGHKRGFFGSYCFLVKSQLWESEAFQNYWSTYRVSSNKEVTLRRGERSFSRRMLEAAENAEAIYSTERFTSLIERLTESALREAIGDMVVTDPLLIRRQDAFISRGLQTVATKDMRDLIYASAKSKNYIGAAPVLSVRDLGFPMIKKNNERHYMLARHRILQAADEGRLTGLDPMVVDEIRQSCAKA